MNFIKITEQPSIHEDLEQKSVRELLEGINEEDRKVASAVHACDKFRTYYHFDGYICHTREGRARNLSQAARA